MEASSLVAVAGRRARADSSRRHLGNGVAAGAKGHGLVVHADQPCVADGHPMGIAAEVAKDLFRAAEGALGVDDPARLIQALTTATGGGWTRALYHRKSLAKAVGDGAPTTAAGLLTMRANGEYLTACC